MARPPLSLDTSASRGDSSFFAELRILRHALRDGPSGEPLPVRVFYHDKCFDGACSASLFSRFYRDCVRSDVQFEYHGLVHRAGALFNEADFTGDENAIVDFKYSPSPRITWWFDHHQSAFLTPADHADYERGQADGSQTMRKFFDPDYTSCCSFLAHIAETKFGFEPSPVVRELVKWADIVDGALYESAEAAVEMREPAMRLTMVIESTQDPKLIPALVPMLTEKSLVAVLEDPLIAPLLPLLLQRHREDIALIRDRATCQGRVIQFDITDRYTEGYNKFIPYYLFPRGDYNVGLSRSSFRTKVAVGTNPWTKTPADKLVNLAEVCERYGGGGHARVGAISFAPDRADEARKASAEIVAQLQAAEWPA